MHQTEVGPGFGNVRAKFDDFFVTFRGSAIVALLLSGLRLRENICQMVVAGRVLTEGWSYAKDDERGEV